MAAAVLSLIALLCWLQWLERVPSAAQALRTEQNEIGHWLQWLERVPSSAKARWTELSQKERNLTSYRLCILGAEKARERGAEPRKCGTTALCPGGRGRCDERLCGSSAEMRLLVEQKERIRARRKNTGRERVTVTVRLRIRLKLWYSRNWLILSQRLQWQLAGSGGKNA